MLGWELNPWAQKLGPLQAVILPTSSLNFPNIADDQKIQVTRAPPQ